MQRRRSRGFSTPARHEGWQSGSWCGMGRRSWGERAPSGGLHTEAFLHSPSCLCYSRGEK
ncbi:unnamed protein product [Ectocarpus sp. 4 AP-2014]